MASEMNPAEAAGSAGMPQLDFSTYANQIFWLVVALVVLYFVISRIAIPRIAAVLEERRNTIASELARAEELKRKAEEAEAAYEKALAEARAEAHQIIVETREALDAELKEAQAKAEEEIARMSAEAEARIAEMRESALAHVAEVARDVAGTVIGAIMPHLLDEKAVAQAVEKRVKEVSR